MGSCQVLLYRRHGESCLAYRQLQGLDENKLITMVKRITYKNKSCKSEELSGMKRRDFFKLLGGGIFIFFQPWDPFELLELQTQQRRSLPTEFNAFLQIAEDGLVYCYTGKVELGQGAITSLVQIMADELEVPFEMVKMVMSDTDLCPWDGGTTGSNTIRTFSPA